MFDTLKAVVIEAYNKLPSDKLANILYSSVIYLIFRSGYTFCCFQIQLYRISTG